MIRDPSRTVLHAADRNVEAGFEYPISNLTLSDELVGLSRESTFTTVGTKGA